MAILEAGKVFLGTSKKPEYILLPFANRHGLITGATGFVGAAMVWFAATGFCIMANGLYWLGAEPRLAPEYGTRRAVSTATDQPVNA